MLCSVVFRPGWDGARLKNRKEKEKNMNEVAKKIARIERVFKRALERPEVNELRMANAMLDLLKMNLSSVIGKGA